MTVSTNAGRIAFLAAQAKRLYKPFTRADVPPSLLVSAVFVHADPDKPETNGKEISVASPIERIVLKSKPKPDVVIQPSSFETEAVEWANLLGGKVQGNRALAVFSLDEVRSLPAGDFDVVLVTQAGERRCKVGTGDRSRLFQ